MAKIGGEKPARLASVVRLYEVFERYRARAEMPHCEHCMSSQEIHDLCAIPLEELTDPLLRKYAWHAIGTVGEANDFRHFLPAVFERMLVEDGSIDAEVIISKLPQAGWESWPAVEQQAVREFLAEWWLGVISNPPGAWLAESCLCAIAQVTDDLASFLDAWRRCPGPAPLQHVAEALGLEYGGLIRGETPIRAWWEARPRQMQQFLD